MNYKNYSNKIDKNISNNLGLEGIFGVGSSGKTISSNNALKNSDIVYACINLISSTISRMPVNLYKNIDNGKEKIQNELISMLRLRPNVNMSGADWLQAMISNLLLHGNGYSWIKTNKGVPKELILLDSSITTIEKVNGKLFVLTSVDNKQYKLPYASILHIKDLTVDGINGISRIQCLRNKLSNRVESDEMIGNMYRNGGNGSIKGILNVPSSLDNQAKKKLKQGFMNVLNADNSGIAVLDDGIKLDTINKMSLVDQQFIDNMKLSKEDIAMIYGLNPVLLGSTDNASYSNMVQIHQSFIQSLIPTINKLELELTYKLLAEFDRIDHYFRLNVSSALRENDEARASFYSKMLEKGVMSINEVRAKEELNSVEGGDTIRVDLNHVALDKVDDYQKNKSLQGVNYSNTEEE